MQIDKNLLKFLVPIKQLQTEHREKLAEQSHVIELNAGDQLSANEEHRWFLYLLRGKLDLLDINQPVLVSHADKRANHPLFGEAAHKSHLLAQTTCKIARVDKQLFHTFLHQELLSGEELETVEMGEVEGNLFNEIMHAFNMGTLQLPSLPEIAMKVKTALSQPETSADDVTRIITADPAMATRLIGAANGPLSRGIEPVTSIHMAVVRLGLQACKDLVISFSIRQLFKSRTPILKERMQQLYDKSIDVAAIGFALSRQSGKLNPDHVLLAGLIHEIGVIPVLAHIETTGLIVNDTNELEYIISSLKSVVGAMVVRHWGLPNDLLIVVEDYADWKRDSGSQADVCDMITLADIYSRLKQHAVKGLPKIEQVPAFKKIFPAQQNAEFVKQVFEHAEHEIDSIKRLMKI